MAIGANIKRIRTLKHVKVADLANTTGIKPESIYAWERGQYNPNEENLQALAAALGVPIKDFYDENHAPVQNEAAVAGKPLEEMKGMMQALMDLEKIGDYRFVPKTVLDGEYRIMPKSELEQRTKELEQKAKEYEDLRLARMDTIKALEKVIAVYEDEIATLRARLAAPQKTE